MYAVLVFVTVCLFALVLLSFTSSQSNKLTTCWVTMTTVPERIKSAYFREVINVILSQREVEVLVLNVPYVCKRSGEEYSIPEWIHVEPRIVVNRCDDLGPATKVLGGRHLFPDNAAIVQFDDDIIYQDFAVRGLLDAYDPKCVTCWHSHSGIPFGFSGCIASSKTYQKLDTALLTDDCFFVDDNWFAWAFKRLGISVKSVNPANSWNVSALSIDDHEPWYELQHHSNRDLLINKCANSLKIHSPTSTPRVRGSALPRI
jgi:hypothetical protein